MMPNSISTWTSHNYIDYLLIGIRYSECYLPPVNPPSSTDIGTQHPEIVPGKPIILMLVGNSALCIGWAVPVANANAYQCMTGMSSRHV